MTRRSRKSTLYVLLLWTRWYFLASGYSSSEVSSRRLKSGGGLSQHAPKQISEIERLESSGRRMFLSTVLSLGGVSILAPGAVAADFSSRGITTGNGNSNGIPGTVAVSKKVGGLANKIRGICLHMVCDICTVYDTWEVPLN